MVCVTSLKRPGPNTSATWPSFTNAAICDSRTVSCAPYWISMSCIGYRYARVVSSSSVHWMTSMNCFLMKSISAMGPPGCQRNGNRVYREGIAARVPVRGGGCDFPPVPPGGAVRFPPRRRGGNSGDAEAKNQEEAGLGAGLPVPRAVAGQGPGGRGEPAPRREPRVALPLGSRYLHRPQRDAEGSEARGRAGGAARQRAAAPLRPAAARLAAARAEAARGLVDRGEVMRPARRLGEAVARRAGDHPAHRALEAHAVTDRDVQRRHAGARAEHRPDRLAAVDERHPRPLARGESPVLADQARLRDADRRRVERNADVACDPEAARMCDALPVVEHEVRPGLQPLEGGEHGGRFAK